MVIFISRLEATLSIAAGLIYKLWPKSRRRQPTTPPPLLSARLPSTIRMYAPRGKGIASLTLLASVLTTVSATVVPGASTPLFYLVSSSTTSSANLFVSTVPPLLLPPTLTTYIARPAIRRSRDPLLRYPCSPILPLRRLAPHPFLLHFLPPDLYPLSTLQSLL